MAIQCGLCKNTMPTSSFLGHRERKHSMVERVPYVKVPDDVLKNVTKKPLVKCRFCPNRVPEDAMERHLKRSHVHCQLCSKTLLKSNYEKHMQQKHSSNLMNSAHLSQSKASLQSDGGSSIDSSVDSMVEQDPLPVPFQPPSPSTSTASCSDQNATGISDFIRVTDWQLWNYIRQGRVYRKDGFLYLRNINTF